MNNLNLPTTYEHDEFSDLRNEVIGLIDSNEKEESSRNMSLGQLLYTGFSSGLSGKELESHVDALRVEAGLSITAVWQILTGFKVDPDIGMKQTETPVRLPVNRFALENDPNYQTRGLVSLLGAYADRVERNLQGINERESLSGEGIDEVMDAYFHTATENRMNLTVLNEITLKFINKYSNSDKKFVKTAAILREVFQNANLNPDFLVKRSSLFLPYFRRAQERRYVKQNAGIEMHDGVQPMDSREYLMVENKNIQTILTGILESAQRVNDFGTIESVNSILNNINGVNEPAPIVLEG